MTRARIFRVVTQSPLLGMALGVCLLVGLGSLLPLPRAARGEKLSASWTASPDLPRPLFLEQGHEARLAPDSFGSNVSVVVSSLAAHAVDYVERTTRLDRHFPISFGDYGPLYRRPPPSLS